MQYFSHVLDSHITQYIACPAALDAIVSTALANLIPHPHGLSPGR